MVATIKKDGEEKRTRIWENMIKVSLQNEREFCKELEIFGLAVADAYLILWRPTKQAPSFLLKANGHSSESSTEASGSLFSKIANSGTLETLTPVPLPSLKCAWGLVAFIIQGTVHSEELMWPKDIHFSENVLFNSWIKHEKFAA